MPLDLAIPANHEKQKGYWRAWSKKRNTDHRARLQEIKLERGCADCGYRGNPVALQFDHVRGEKLFAVGSAGGRSWASIELEIEKCEVVCANCHAIRTNDRLKER